MDRPTWSKVFAYIGIAIMSLALALFSTSVATAGVTAGLLGARAAGADLFSWGSAILLGAIASAAVFSYLAIRGARALRRVA